VVTAEFKTKKHYNWRWWRQWSPATRFPACAAPTALHIYALRIPRAYAPGLNSFASCGGWCVSWHKMRQSAIS